MTTIGVKILRWMDLALIFSMANLNFYVRFVLLFFLFVCLWGVCLFVF